MRQLDEILFNECLEMLTNQDVNPRSARSFIGKLRKFNRDADILVAFADAEKSGIVDLIPWLSTVLITEEQKPQLTVVKDEEQTEQDIKIREFKKEMESITLVRSALNACDITIDDDTMCIYPLTNFARTVITNRLSEMTEASDWRVRIDT
jgi:hypothetical protein